MSMLTGLRRRIPLLHGDKELKRSGATMRMARQRRGRLSASGEYTGNIQNQPAPDSAVAPQTYNAINRAREFVDNSGGLRGAAQNVGRILRSNAPNPNPLGLRVAPTVQPPQAAPVSAPIQTLPTGAPTIARDTAQNMGDMARNMGGMVSAGLRRVAGVAGAGSGRLQAAGATANALDQGIAAERARNPLGPTPTPGLRSSLSPAAPQRELPPHPNQALIPEGMVAKAPVSSVIPTESTAPRTGLMAPSTVGVRTNRGIVASQDMSPDLARRSLGLRSGVLTGRAKLSEEGRLSGEQRAGMITRQREGGFGRPGAVREAQGLRQAVAQKEAGVGPDAQAQAGLRFKAGEFALDRARDVSVAEKTAAGRQRPSVLRTPVLNPDGTFARDKDKRIQMQEVEAGGETMNNEEMAGQLQNELDAYIQSKEGGIFNIGYEGKDSVVEGEIARRQAEIDALTGGEQEFASVADAERAGLPKGTIVIVNGRRAVID